jgi:hypothetical protein
MELLVFLFVIGFITIIHLIQIPIVQPIDLPSNQSLYELPNVFHITTSSVTRSRARRCRDDCVLVAFA